MAGGLSDSSPLEKHQVGRIAQHSKRPPRAVYFCVQLYAFLLYNFKKQCIKLSSKRVPFLIWCCNLSIKQNIRIRFISKCVHQRLFTAIGIKSECVHLAIFRNCFNVSHGNIWRVNFYVKIRA